MLARETSHARGIAPGLRAVAMLALGGLVVAGANEARAVASPWAETEQTAVRLVSAVTGSGGGTTVAGGLHFRLHRGWKVYWRSPGDAGFPPRVDWAGSENLAAVALSWPMPGRFSVLGFETLGYEDEVVLPVTFTAAEPGRPLGLHAKVSYLACKDVCIPYDVGLALTIPAGPAEPTEFAHLINRFSVRVPGDGAAAGLSIERGEVVGAGREVALRVTARSVRPFVSPDLYVEGPNDLSFGAPKVVFSDGGYRAILKVAVGGAQTLETPLAGTRLTVTLVDGDRAAERTLTPVPAAEDASASSLVAMLALAMLGGLILNLMPCVLPVLSLKLMGVLGQGGRERRQVRLGFIASSAGIVSSFLVLAGVLATLRATGTTIGWGIQFQQPWFLVAMAVVVTLFACNLWGLFEIHLPRRLADAGGRADGAGGLGASFATGAFATLLATPCSAPFLGTAVGFALAQNVGDIFAVFTALGIGLALPYLVVAAAPGLATALPRPGPWMVVARRILGVALAGTAAWLVSILASGSGDAAAAAVGTALIAVATCLALTRRLGRRPGRIGALALAALVALAFVAGGVIARGPEAAPETGADAAKEASLWRPFDEAAIAQRVAEGKVVFVDVTAKWCVTCQVNKSLVLYRGETFRRLAAPEVVAMQADWTQPDDAIARYLAGFGRYGIPFDAVYGPGAPRGITLPELLSERAVLDALDRAAGPRVTADGR